jgi:hypothetical protein
MKNFLKYLEETQKVYEFRIKIANIDPKDKMDILKTALEAYAVEKLSEAKTIPIKSTDVDFPSMKNVELYIMDAVLKYPVNDAQLRSLIAEKANIPANNIVVVPKYATEEVWRWDVDGESELREYKQGEAVLDKPYEDNPEATKAGEKYQKADTILKELSKVKIESEGSESTDAQTTNEIPTGTESPVGSKQNQIPKAKD